MLGLPMRSFWLLACLVAVTLAASLEQRATANYSAPVGYTYDWTVPRHRLSYTTGAFISRKSIKKSTVMTQDAVYKCGAICTENTECNFFHPIEIKGYPVMCALYKTRMAKTKATTVDRGQENGNAVVVNSYGFFRTTPNSTKRTTSTSTRRSSTRSFGPPSSAVPGSTSTKSATSTKSSTSSSSSSKSTSKSTSTSTSSSTKSTSTSSSSKSTTNTLPPRPTTTRRTTTTTSKPATTTKTTTSTTSTTTRSSTTTSTTSSTTTRSTTTSPATSSTPTTTGTSTTKTRTGSYTKTTTSTTMVAPSNYPPPPAGATMIKYKGCSTTDYTVPIMVNKNYPIGRNDVSTSDTVWLVQHGSKRDFDDSFNALYRIVGDQGVIISPNFYAAGDPEAPSSWYESNSTLAWDSNDWFNGADAILPADTGACSSFDIIDSLIDDLRDTTRFPNLKRIISVAHSGGSSMMMRYGMLSPNTDIIYVLANTPATPYFTTARPIPPQDCKYFMAWGYGFTYSLPRYVAATSPGPLQAFKNWIKLDVTLMTGTYDTYSRDSTGDQSCYAVCEGGQNRRDRGYAYWAYLNLYAGTSTDVSAYYGYDALKSQVEPVSPAPRFKTRHCNVDMVAHYNYGMYSSACGRAAIYNNSTLPADPGPLRPA